MAKIEEIKTDKIEREYTVPLREKCRSVPRYKKANKAIKTIKEFVARHMKIYDRDLNKVKIDRSLNEMVWLRGIRKPPAKIKIKAIKEGDIVRVEAVDIFDKIKFKKEREEKREKKALDKIGKKKVVEEKDEKPAEEKKEEEKEKKAAVVEAGKKIEKAAARQAKHMEGGKTKEPKHLRRVALQK